MDIIGWVNDAATALPDPLIWLLGLLFSTAESGLWLGLVVPGEPVVLLLAAMLDSAPGALVLFLAVALGGSIGDQLGYLLGRRSGGRLRDSAIVRRLGVDGWDRAVEALERRGAQAVFLTRLVPVLRCLTPTAAGVARVPYRSFLAASLLGSLLWSAVYVGVGSLVRATLDTVRQYLGATGWVLLFALVVVVTVVAIARFRRGAAIPGDEAMIPVTLHEKTPLARLRTQLFSDDDWKNLPNAITAGRIVLLPVFAALVITGSYWAALVVGAVVFLSDVADGQIARRMGTVSALGTWLDGVADRLTVVVVAASFAIAQIIPWQVFVVMIVPDLLLAFVAVVAFRGTPEVPVSIAGKIRTVFLFVGFFALLIGLALGGGDPASALYRVFGGVGFVAILLGLLGHFVAATQYARRMVVTWQRQGVRAAR
ncbi:CDP-alcohol phosphatidyltransferase family protein [Plantibacter cousiniae (nom. nud.)]|uniref:CDP-alcohol phosphatidyltransferase family protein n=1 Tax=Plantibacter cousiniae (nom. nud.) TaxID=199709 RepID=UPI001D9D6804|nr:CDP-alcohol phosphatidyltransferase family protein [Plantibacter cousiniae]CAH0228411.1 Putative CDP-diacylglycerol--glycerol-3-phosphate 3-phosphatidyl-transferase 1 [Plantibacter cousiniae]